MGSINFNNLKNINISQKKYLYTDIFLDLIQEPLEISTKNNKGRDIKISYNQNAIKNSINNLFNTSPGDRILLPDYGCDLKSYVFEPVSESNAMLIGRTIKDAIQQWEPRVEIDSIGVDAYIDEQRYEIELKLNIVFLLNEIFNMRGILDIQGFNII